MPPIVQSWSDNRAGASRDRRDVDQDLADDAPLDRVVGRGGLRERVMVKRKAGLLPGPQRPGGDGRGDVRGRGREVRRVEGVEQEELVAQVQAEGPANLYGERVAAVVGVNRDGRAIPRHRDVELVVDRGGNLCD